PRVAGQAVIETWAGLRPRAPDDLPILGADPRVEGLIYATGHYRNGILLAPITALAISELVVNGESPSPPPPSGAPGSQTAGPSAERVKQAYQCLRVANLSTLDHPFQFFRAEGANFDDDLVVIERLFAPLQPAREEDVNDLVAGAGHRVTLADLLQGFG